MSFTSLNGFLPVALLVPGIGTNRRRESQGHYFLSQQA
jgi:hypothetical protein